MTANEAKKLMKEFLAAEGVEYDKLTAKTVSFTDLCRAECIFVKIHSINWQTVGNFETVTHFAKANGFRAQAQ